MSKYIPSSSDVRLKVIKGEYSNDDAYTWVLNYVIKKNLWGGYGFFPYDLESAVKAFENSEDLSIHKVPRKVWHFVITFKRKWDIQTLYTMGNQIAYYFAQNYQVAFAVDTDGYAPHLHFAVNNYSYHPEMETLTDEQMRSQCIYILSDIKKAFPCVHHTTFSFQGGSHV